MFSLNTLGGTRRKIVARSSFREVDDLGFYLGVSLSGNSLRISNFQFIIGKVCAKLSNWKCNQMSFAGKVTLAKSVIEALPTYYLMLFLHL